MINYDTENATAEVDTHYRDFYSACQEILNTPGLPAGLIREVERELNSETEAVEQYRSEMVAKMGKVNDALDRARQSQALLAEALGRVQERG